MKTTNNAQKTENRTLESSISKTFVVVLSLVLFSFAANAGEFRKNLPVNNTSGETTSFSKAVTENNLEIENQMNKIEYRAAEIVAAEMTYEIESYKNSNTEAIEAELAPQFEAWISNTKYNSQDFVAAEMATEISKSQEFLTVK